MMGSFRRPRPRFMSSPVLSDLARFHASLPSLQISNSRVWNSVQSAVIKVFQGGELQTNELYTLNESIRWLLKTEMGSFITDYFQNQLLTRGLAEVLDQVLLHSGDERLLVLADMWDQVYTETLPTLQAIFYPVQGQELTVRQMTLLAFRDLVVLKLHLGETLGTAASIPPAVTQMLLVLQGVHQCGAPSPESCQLERLLELVVSPYLSDVLQDQNQLLPEPRQRFRPDILVTQHLSSSDGCSLAPLVEQEGEAYLEKAGGVRRHTVASGHSDLRLLAASGRMQGSKEGAGPMGQRTFSGQLDMGESLRGGAICLPHS
ncbi:proline-rich protein 5-like [Clinocottus analis]|uniref:proline-rich protein 5-like n=1 Tax=Clinocottus analis TaxID=304258 RepID=UPI0035C1A9D8